MREAVKRAIEILATTIEQTVRTETHITMGIEDDTELVIGLTVRIQLPDFSIHTLDIPKGGNHE